MPSKRPPSHAMDEAAAAAARLEAASARSSKSRSSKSRARARDRRRSPNPNPSSRKRGKEPGSVSAPRKSHRRPKPRAFPDSTTLAAAVAASASAPAAASPRGAAQKLWSDADEVALLTGAAAFKERSGVAPRLPDMGDLYEFLKDSISPHLDQAKVYYKLKRLKSKFQHTTPGATSTPHDRLVRDLSADLWGAELAHAAAADERPVEEGADVVEAEGVDAVQVPTGGDLDEPEPGRLPIVREVLGEYWRLNGRVLSGVSLEKGLSLVGPDVADAVEAKWRRHLEADMRMQMRWHDLGKEVHGLLMDAIKGLGP